jgi:hypothetical protein
VDLYIHSPIRLHGVVLNELSTGDNLVYLLILIIYSRFLLLTPSKLHLLICILEVRR